MPVSLNLKNTVFVTVFVKMCQHQWRMFDDAGISHSLSKSVFEKLCQNQRRDLEHTTPTPKLNLKQGCH
jgi:uncharacterized membrane protein